MTQNLSNEIMTEIEKERLLRFSEDKLTFDAVKKYILAVCYKQGVITQGVEHNPNINYALNLAWGAVDGRGMPRTDEELGQNLRALTCAVQLVGSGFKDISEMKQVDELKDSAVNEGE